MAEFCVWDQKKLRILILDDAAIVRWGVRQILADEGFDPLAFGEGSAGPEGLDLALGQPWDLIVAIDLPGRGGKVLAELKRMRPDQLILALVIRVGEGQLGVASSPGELVSAARRVRAPGMSGESNTAIQAPSEWRGRPEHGNLSKREREVLRLIGSGRTAKEIAAVLVLSEKTISTYRSRLLTKLGLKSTAELIRYALMNGLAE